MRNTKKINILLNYIKIYNKNLIQNQKRKKEKLNTIYIKYQLLKIFFVISLLKITLL